MRFRTVGAHSLRCVVATTLFCSPLLQAQVVSTTEHQVLSPASLSDEYFGNVVAISGDTVVVGAERARVNGAPSAGRAYVYQLGSGTWSLEAVLTSSDTALGQRFGDDVAIDGDRLVVGAPGDSVLFPNAGAAYVFERNGSAWTETQKLIDSAPGTGHLFGLVVELEGEQALVGGTDFDNHPDDFANQLHAFSFNGGVWGLDEVISSPYPDPFLAFGSPLALEAGFLATAAQQSVPVGGFPGLSGTLEFMESTPSGWVSTQSVTSVGLLTDIDLSGDLCVTGNFTDLTVYRRVSNSWTEEATLVPSTPGTESSYGLSCAVDGSRIVVGARGFTFGTLEQGEATIFDYVDGAWTETAKLFGSTDEGNEYLGRTVALEGNALLLGARSGGIPGKVYAYDLSEAPMSFCEGNGADAAGCGDCPCSNDASPGATGGCLNVSGTSASLLVSGAPSVTNDALRFELRDANPSTFAILVSASQQAPANASNPCFGVNSGIASPALRGLRCVVQDVRRQGTRAIDAQGSVGDSNAGWGGSDNPTAGLLAQGGLVAGQTRHFQAFYREGAAAVCQREQNTTQGISIVVRP